jgi:cyclophilin family peptidyl-prolyl cis-trans isomerase
MHSFIWHRPFVFDQSFCLKLYAAMTTASFSYRAISIWLSILILAFEGLDAIPTTDGLYSEFQTTEGTFYAQLDFDKAPMTVANFVGLAEGSRPWVDFNTGAVSNAPFYNGLLIPRAEAGFVIQMGSPSNTLSGGPGYSFSDEIHPDLRHASAGILSMANSGADTNGSQFFITLNAASSSSRSMRPLLWITSMPSSVTSWKEWMW